MCAQSCQASKIGYNRRWFFPNVVFPMRTTLPFIAALCLLLFAFAADAQQQQPTPEQVQQQIENQLRSLQSPKKLLEAEADKLVIFRSSWNGQGTVLPLNLMLRSSGEAELRLTDEQKQRLAYLYAEENLGKVPFQRLQQNPTPEFTQAMKAFEALPDDSSIERASEEQKNAYRETVASVMGAMVSVMQADIEETLTAEQMLQVRKLEMQMMSEFGLPFPGMFDPLGLTEDQKKEMNTITDEMEAEFERLALETGIFSAEQQRAVIKTLQGKTFASFEEVHKAFLEVRQQFVPSEASRKKSIDLQEQGTKLASLLQNRLMNVLTDEQLDTMQKILDETPEFAKKLLVEAKARREEQKKSPIYVPGPDSWQPGMPLPVQFKEERKQGKFPRPKQSES
jgi:hypothetical protein